MNPKNTHKIFKILLSVATTVTLSGCPALAHTVDNGTIQKLPYLCNLGIENARLNISNLLDTPKDTKPSTLKHINMYYDAYKRAIKDIQYECPDDSDEAWGVQDTEPLVDALYYYKIK